LLKHTPAEAVGANAVNSAALECPSEFHEFADVGREMGSAIGAKESLQIS
jgi:hypothetical protein